MASVMQNQISLAVQPRGEPIKGIPNEIHLSSQAPLADIYNTLARCSGVSVHRLRITKGSDGRHVANIQDATVNSTGLRDQSNIIVKDLGPQVAWRTVFLLEYIGPLIIHPILYQYFLGFGESEATLLQTLTFGMIMGHFVKRELETIFIHRFSAATMPMSSLIRNVAYYWFLSGLNMAFWVYRPTATAASYSTEASSSSRILTYVIAFSGLALYSFGELGTFITHLILMRLRSPGSTERGIPQGAGFDLVTCPNYMYETIAWIGIVIVSQSLSTVLFAFVAVWTMASWARKKERRYRTEFGSKYKAKKFVILPGIY